MASVEYDTLQYRNVAPRVIECGACKDSRITAMWIDEQANVGLYTPFAQFPWSVVTNETSPRMLGDAKDRYVHDRLPGSGEPLPYAPITTQNWRTDYPGDAHVDRPQGLSLLAAAIVAARRAAGIVDTTGGQ